MLAAVLVILVLTPGRPAGAGTRPTGPVVEVLPQDQTSLPYSIAQTP